jgi:hypothetical protein
MPHVTRLLITLHLDAEDRIAEVVAGLPDCCSSTFQNVGSGIWQGEFIVSCPVAPALADGDFVDDFSPYFPTLVRLKGLYDAEFALEVAVGEPSASSFELRSFSVALLAALGASVTIYDNSTART